MHDPATLSERLATALPALSARLGGERPDLSVIPGEVPVVEVAFPDSDRLSIYVTTSSRQLLCICYLWRDDEIDPARRAALHEELLDLNLCLPLSSFGRIGSHYVVFGALSCQASAEELGEELATLSDNAGDALRTLTGYLER